MEPGTVNQDAQGEHYLYLVHFKLMASKALDFMDEGNYGLAKVELNKLYTALAIRAREIKPPKDEKGEVDE